MSGAVLKLGLNMYHSPTWFQAVRLASPVTSGVDFLPISVAISPSAILEGIIVAKLGHYKLVVSLLHLPLCLVNRHSWRTL